MSPQTVNGGPDFPFDDVSLVYFEANPTHINPFEASLLRWKVTAPQGVRIELDGTPVTKTGEAWVEPPSTQNYHLVARAGGKSMALGHAGVTVNLSRCNIGELSPMDAIIRAGILASTQLLPSGASFWEPGTTVTVTQDLIQIHVTVGSPFAANASAKLDLSFGLTLAPDFRVHGRALGIGLARWSRVATRLAPANESYSASVTVPWYVWLIPGAFPVLSIALAMAEDSMKAKAPGIIQAIVDGVDADFHPDGTEGLQKQTVMVGVDEWNNAFIRANWCSPPSEIVAPSPAESVP